MKIRLAILAVLLCCVAMGWLWLRAPDYDGKVLVFSKTQEYRHASIEAGIETLRDIGNALEVDIVATEDAALFTDASLSQFRAVVFLNTSGNVLQSDQQVALQRYIQAGGGFLGIHAAADTEWKGNAWPWYTQLVGAAFLSHPSPENVQRATLRPVPGELAVDHMGSSVSLTDEWYDFQRIAPKRTVVLRLDESTYEGGRSGADHPIAWYRAFDGGRSFYTGLGHTAEIYAEPLFQRHLQKALAWVMGGPDHGLDYSLSRPEPWRFQEVVLADNLNEPMVLAFTPDSTVYIAERRGAIRRWDAGSEQLVQVAELDVLDEGEHGLLGLAFDPAFADNGWMYTLQTRYGLSGPEHALVPYTLRGDELVAGSAITLLSFPVQLGGNHTGGDMLFDGSGHLWISTGDNTNPHESDGYSPQDDRPGRLIYDAARSAANTQDLRGKILRIKPHADGSYSVPRGNLFDMAEAGRPEIFAMGLRNPFRISFDDTSETLFWGEIGPDSRVQSDRGPVGYDEFNRTRLPGNFGWPFVIGPNTPYARFDFAANIVTGVADPLAPVNASRNNTGAGILPPAVPAWMWYPYDVSARFPALGQGGRSAMAGPVYRYDDYPDNPAKLPRYYDGKLLIFEWVRRWLKIVDLGGPRGDGFVEDLLVNPLSAPIDVAFAPDGSLYVLEYGSGWFSGNPDARLSRIDFNNTDNAPPLARIDSGELVGPVPLSLVLDGRSSYDRNGPAEALAYHWEASHNGGLFQTVGDKPVLQMQLSEPGIWQLRLTVTDEQGAWHRDSVQAVAGNGRPKVDIEIDGNDSFFFEDTRLVNYRVSVEDQEQGSTATGAILPAAINFRTEFLPVGEPRAEELERDGEVHPGLVLIESSDCMGCHNQSRVSVGPSYNAIRDRYRGQSLAPLQLADIIIGGGAGNWGEFAMPAHPGFSRDQAQTMASYILGLRQGMTSLEGVLPLTAHSDTYRDSDFAGPLYDGLYRLRASYVDNGNGGVPPLEGTAVKRLRFHRLPLSRARTVPGSRIMTPEAAGGMPLLTFSPADESGVAPYVPDIDLTGIARIRVGVLTSKFVTTGGRLELRWNSPTGPVLGNFTIENRNIGMPDQLYYYATDVQAYEGSGDLYLVGYLPPEKDATAIAFIVGVVEFLREGDLGHGESP